jgi:hypothetical protein
MQEEEKECLRPLPTTKGVRVSSRFQIFDLVAPNMAGVRIPFQWVT